MNGVAPTGGSATGRPAPGGPASGGPASGGAASGGLATRGPADGGFATVLAAAAVAVMMLLLGLGLALAGAILGRHRAESAADLAALAGASQAVSGTETACGAARDVARTNGAVLTGCTWRGWVVTVTVTRPCACAPSVSGSAVGRASAGPLTSDGDPVIGSW